jgi:hypothetical protein
VVADGHTPPDAERLTRPFCCSVSRIPVSAQLASPASPRGEPGCVQEGDVQRLVARGVLTPAALVNHGRCLPGRAMCKRSFAVTPRPLRVEEHRGVQPLHRHRITRHSSGAARTMSSAHTTNELLARSPRQPCGIGGIPCPPKLHHGTVTGFPASNPNDGI